MNLDNIFSTEEKVEKYYKLLDAGYPKYIARNLSYKRRKKRVKNRYMYDTKYNGKRTCKRALKFLSAGNNKSLLIEELKITKSTLFIWMGKYPEFKEAVETGLEIGKGKFLEKVYKCGFDPDNKPTNNSLVKMYANNVYNITSEGNGVSSSRDKDDGGININISVKE
jgi:hypothetical protein